MPVSAPGSDREAGAFLRHGGRLAAARGAFPDAPAPWLDLSTGINPRPYRARRADPAALRRLPDPEEVAALGVYLCSEAASGTSGAAMRVDGGVVNQIM